MNNPNKLILNNDEVVSSFFLNTRLLAIVSSIKDYKLCFLINKYYKFNFRMDPSHRLMVKKKYMDYYFTIYNTKDIVNETAHFLYENRSGGEYLLPELLHVDFIWLMRGDALTNSYVDFIMSLLKKMNEVQIVYELPIDKVIHKEFLIFE